MEVVRHGRALTTYLKELAMKTILLCSATALLLALTGLALADKTEKIHDALIVSVTADTLVITDPDGKNERSQKVDAATAVTIDGKPAKLPELSKGDRAKVAIDEDGKVVRIAAMRTAKK
jgi:hypothetical protein